MHSLDENFLKSLTFKADQLTILRTIGEYQGKQELYFKQSPEILKGLQQVAIIESSESSNRLEGITAPHHRIAELITQDTMPKDRSEQEIAGYRDALNLIHQSAKHMPFSLNVVLQLHSWIYRYLFQILEVSGKQLTMKSRKFILMAKNVSDLFLLMHLKLLRLWKK